MMPDLTPQLTISPFILYEILLLSRLIRHRSEIVHNVLTVCSTDLNLDISGSIYCPYF